MELFKVHLLVSEKYQDSEVEVKTYDLEFGKKMIEHVNEFSGKPAVLSLKTIDGYQLIRQDEIIYVEVFGKEVNIHLNGEQVVVRQALTSLEKLLDSKKFVRVAKSTIINLNKLQRLEVAFSGNYYGFLQDDCQVVISRRYFQQLKNKLTL
ncbi:LytTR family DNA-binding domain-containing protein [Enterococcus sp. AZ072]|uniref:LytTR family DNA-binding domain-containing protein n=1 Tax=unclassified Enterococcus TaxID=2608891 RepID=UPI003D27746C